MSDTPPPPLPPDQPSCCIYTTTSITCIRVPLVQDGLASRYCSRHLALIRQHHFDSARKPWGFADIGEVIPLYPN